MGRMRPDEFFGAFVEGNVRDCEECPGDVRRAFNAAVATSHFADHHYIFSKRHNPNSISAFRSLGEFVAHLNRETGGAFGDIRSISNVYKHLYASDKRKSSVHASVSSSGAIQAIWIENDKKLKRLEEDFSSYAQKGKTAVVFTRKDGTTCEFLPVLLKSVDHLRELMWQSFYSSLYRATD